ncbi:hypothetical protein TFLX_03704 [Thermoflexales bacterium]|nr:hypothetical protein TFLX_03704 [Thermoflexales bacterium]
MNTRLNVLIAGLLSAFLVGCAPAANAARTAVVSPLPTPSSDIQIESTTDIALTAAKGTQLPSGLFFRVAQSGLKLYGAGAVNPNGVALYQVDLKTGSARQIGTWRKGIGSIHASERYVVWEQTSDSQEYTEIHVYDLQQDREMVLAIHTAWVDISGDTVVWGDVQAYNLALGKPIEVKNLHGRPSYPTISDQWVIYLDPVTSYVADIYAHNLSTSEDFKIGTMPMLGDRIGTVDWYPVISGKNIVWVSEDNQLHQYDLNSRTDRVLPVSVSLEDSLNTPRFLALDGDTLVYEQGTWVGYDLARNVAFPISRTSSQDNRGKRTMSTPVLISNGRLVWQTQIDETVNLYMADLIKNP